jgi:hypothetical protein
MSKTHDISNLDHATLEDRLTEEELNAAAGSGKLADAAVHGAFYGGIGAAGGPGTCYGDYGIPYECHPVMSPYHTWP